MAEWLAWIGIFMILLSSYLYCLWTAKNRKAYLIYFLAGMAIGFYSDYVSFTNGYYSYPGIFKLSLLGLPVTMTVAEGFAAAIIVKIFERTKNFLKF